jgi:hypothetical protein
MSRSRRGHTRIARMRCVAKHCPSLSPRRDVRVMPRRELSHGVMEVVEEVGVTRAAVSSVAYINEKDQKGGGTLGHPIDNLACVFS